MKHAFLDQLVCPECRCDLELSVEEERSTEVYSGSLTCRQAGHVYSITKFVPRFVDADRYAESFSRQRLYVRRHFDLYRADRSGDEQFWPTTGFTPERIRSGINLEVGCGYGRFIDVVQRAGGSIVGVDLSTISIELAQDFVGLRPKVFLAQCDLFKLPFRPGSFANVFSIGVLHHTPDTHDAFCAIVPYAATDGRLSIWVYEPKSKRATNVWRKITTRMPAGLLYACCIANQVLLSPICALPGGWRVGYIFPGASPDGRPFWTRVNSAFDAFSPSYAHVHTSDEVAAWFIEAGLSDVQVLDRPSSVTGRQR